jgi:putative transposase
MGRGIEKTKIFREDRDRDDFVSCLPGLGEEGFFLIYAWALMENHFHLLVRTGRRSLSQNMCKLLTGYVINFKRRNKGKGYLFQNRYKSIVCEEDPYLLELTRYIHLNPVRAGEGPAGAGKISLDGSFGLDGLCAPGMAGYGDDMVLFRAEAEAGDSGLRGVCAGRISPRGGRPELAGGGLLRSIGGWGEVKSLRRRGVEAAGDQRVPWGSEFVERVLAEAGDVEVGVRRGWLEELVKKVAVREGASEMALRRGRRGRRVTKARRTVCRTAIERLGYSGTEAARALGVATSAVVPALQAEETDIRKYLRVRSKRNPPGLGFRKIENNVPSEGAIGRRGVWGTRGPARGRE